MRHSVKPFIGRLASHADAESIVRLVNRAFAIEHFFKEGERTDLEDIRRHLENGVFLVCTHGSEMVGCIYIQATGERGYVGLLSVDPTRQGQGLGSLLMQHAEDYCAGVGCVRIDLRIINLRPELLAFYAKRGYVECGTESAEVVKGAKLPVHFVLMSKELPNLPLRKGGP
jgi:GNAT superfamily N-acetyltransferase